MGVAMSREVLKQVLEHGVDMPVDPWTGERLLGADNHRWQPSKGVEDHVVHLKQDCTPRIEIALETGARNLAKYSLATNGGAKQSKEDFIAPPENIKGVHGGGAS